MIRLLVSDRVRSRDLFAFVEIGAHALDPATDAKKSDAAASLDWYVGEVLAARSEFEIALRTARLRYWPSRANFILVDIGPRHNEFVRHMLAAGVLVRDRSSDPGCDGRVRITIGTREQMKQAVAALNDTLALLRGTGVTP